MLQDPSTAQFAIMALDVLEKNELEPILSPVIGMILKVLSVRVCAVHSHRHGLFMQLCL